MRYNRYLLELDEFVSFAQLFQIRHRLRVVQTVFVIHFTVARQLAKLRHHQYHSLSKCQENFSFAFWFYQNAILRTFEKITRYNTSI